MKILHNVIMATGFVALFSACENTTTGSFNLRITDAPVHEASAVNVQFSGVELKSAGNENVLISLDTPARINLMDLQGSLSQSLVSDYEIAAGEYQWIRLLVDTGASETTIVVNGEELDMEIPSGAQTGLKLVRGFTMPEDGKIDFTVDFDLSKSVVRSNTGYKLKPVLRIVETVSGGHIKGVVDASTLTANSCGDTGNAVYVFAGSDVTPSDIDGSGKVITSALVNYNIDKDEYGYEAGYLEAGDYTVALTCEADMDNAEQADVIAFVAVANVSVEQGGTSTHHF